MTSQRLSETHTHLPSEHELAMRLAFIRDDPTHRHHVFASYISSLPYSLRGSFETDDARDQCQVYQSWRDVEPWDVLSRPHYDENYVHFIPMLDLDNHEDGSSAN